MLQDPWNSFLNTHSDRTMTHIRITRFWNWIIVNINDTIQVPRNFLGDKFQFSEVKVVCTILKIFQKIFRVKNWNWSMLGQIHFHIVPISKFEILHVHFFKSIRTGELKFQIFDFDDDPWFIAIRSHYYYKIHWQSCLVINYKCRKWNRGKIANSDLVSVRILNDFRAQVGTFDCPKIFLIWLSVASVLKLIIFDSSNNSDSL